MTLKELQNNIIKLADFYYKTSKDARNDSYDSCLYDATQSYLDIVIPSHLRKSLRGLKLGLVYN